MKKITKIPNAKILETYRYGEFIMTVVEEDSPYYKNGPMYHFYITGLGRTLGMFAIPKAIMEASIEDVVLWNIEEEVARFKDIYYKRGDYTEEYEDD